MKKLILATMALITLCFTACEPETVTLDCQSNMSVGIDGCIENDQGEWVPNIVLNYFISDGCLAPTICYTNAITGDQECLPDVVTGSEQTISLTHLAGGTIYSFVLEAIGSYIEQGLDLSVCNTSDDGDNQGGNDGNTGHQSCSSMIRASTSGCQTNTDGVLTPTLALTYQVSMGCTGMTLCYTNDQNEDEVCLEEVIFGERQELTFSDLIPGAQYKFVLTNGSNTLSNSVTTSNCN